MVDELTISHGFSGSHGSYARTWKGHLYVGFRYPQPTQYHVIYNTSFDSCQLQFISIFHSPIQTSICESDIRCIASSALPYRRAPPSWLKTSLQDVVEHITKLARKGLTPSQIGVTLRDSHGIPQVRFVTGNKILRILKGLGTSSISSPPPLPFLSSPPRSLTT